MKVLYVGGVWATEYGLYKESQINPNVSVKVLYCGEGMFGSENIQKVLQQVTVSSRTTIDTEKEKFNPDLTIFRSWCSTSGMVQEGEVFWSQEICATREDGSVAGSLPIHTNNTSLIAYQVKNIAQEARALWLPYCVSKNWSYVPVSKDIPVMIATVIPDTALGGDMKVRSIDILAKLLAQRNPGLLYCYNGNGGVGLQSVSYLKGTLKPSFPYVEMHRQMSRAKIYLSPTTVWNDPGCISQKTIHAMACKTLTLTNRYADIESILGPDGENLVYADTPDEAYDKIMYFLGHDAERQAVAERGYNFIHANYNWEAHLNRLHSEVKERIV